MCHIVNLWTRNAEDTTVKTVKLGDKNADTDGYKFDMAI